MLLGPSGGGKSTLLDILGGLDSATSSDAPRRDRRLVGASLAELTRYRRDGGPGAPSRRGTHRPGRGQSGVAAGHGVAVVSALVTELGRDLWAMRPAPPPAYRHFLFARGSSARVPAAWMMVPREVSARPFHSALTLLGIAVSVRLDPRAEGAFQVEVLASPRIASRGIKSFAVENFRRSTGAVVTVVASVFALFAVSIAFGVVYTNVRIALQEKSRELATLRIIGFTRREVARLLFASSAIELAAGVPPGLALGQHRVRILVLAFETEMFRIPPIVAPASYLWSALAVAGFVGVAIVGRRLTRLDMIGVLKARD